MAVIGIGTNSRTSVEDVVAIVVAAQARLAERDEKAPSLGLSPKGERNRSEYRFGEFRRSFSPRGEGQDEGGLIKSIAVLDRPAFNNVPKDAARRLGLELMLLALDELRAVAHLCVTHSEKSMQQYGIPSVAEAAALAAADPGARLLVPRFCGNNITASVAARP